jgi:hypothetical protein
VRLTPLALVLLLSLSCEKTIIVDVPEHERQIVAKAFFSPGTPWVVHVSSSVGYLDPVDVYALTDATVEIRKDGSILESLRHDNAGYYVSQQSRPEPGNSYTLRVSRPHYESIEALATLPATRIVPRLQVRRGRNDDGNPGFSVAVTLDDPAGERNYYAIDVVQTDRIGDAVFQHLSGFESNDVVLRGFEFGEPDYFNVAYFEDELFDGTAETVDLWVFDPSHTVPDGIISTLEIRVYTTDEAYFRYNRTIERQEETEDNPFVEPVRIYSNTSNGFGIFAGYYVDSVALAEW